MFVQFQADSVSLCLQTSSPLVITAYKQQHEAEDIQRIWPTGKYLFVCLFVV